VWWCISVITVLLRVRQEDPEIEVHIVSSRPTTQRDPEIKPKQTITKRNKDLISQPLLLVEPYDSVLPLFITFSGNLECGCDG
jgi:hypothetical protein